jgi:hypothetical protein
MGIFTRCPNSQVWHVQHVPCATQLKLGLLMQSQFLHTLHCLTPFHTTRTLAHMLPHARSPTKNLSHCRTKGPDDGHVLRQPCRACPALPRCCIPPFPSPLTHPHHVVNHRSTHSPPPCAPLLTFRVLTTGMFTLAQTAMSCMCSVAQALYPSIPLRGASYEDIAVSLIKTLQSGTDQPSTWTRPGQFATLIVSAVGCIRLCSRLGAHCSQVTAIMAIGGKMWCITCRAARFWAIDWRWTCCTLRQALVQEDACV